MRIAIVQGAFLPVPPLRGGAVEKMWFSLGKEFVRQGHEVVQLSRLVDGLPVSEQIEGVQHIRLRSYDTPKSGLVLKFRDLLYSLKVRNALSTDFDIVISNTFWMPLLLSKKLRTTCLVDVQRMPKGQMRFYKQVARLRANSTPVADAIRRELPESHYNKVVMIPNPLPFIPRQDIDFTVKKSVILYVGRIHPEKGLDLLIKAYKQTAQVCRLLLVGPWDIAAGGGGSGYLNLLRELAGNAAVEFAGPVFDVDVLNKFYQEATIFVYPSVAEQGETFGLAPLEAMAWGCVPIVSNLACFQDFIVHSRNGLIFDHRAQNAIQQLADCIGQLQNDQELWKRLGQQALTVRQTHSTHHIAGLLLEEFSHIYSTDSLSGW